MKIVSKFHDYYDSGMAYGHDETLIYNRKPVEIIEQRQPEPRRYGHYHDLNDYVTRFSSIDLEAYFFVVGFCGKLYLGVEIVCGSITYGAKPRITKFFYDVDSIARFVESTNDKHLIQTFNEPEPEWYWRSTRFRFDVIQRMFKNFESVSNKFESRFRDNHSPVFLVTHTEGATNELLFTYNANLKDVCFYGVFDCFRAYQEIEMYLGGVLGRGEKETLQRKDFPDEPLIRDSKGFDKWSFKKRK